MEEVTDCKLETVRNGCCLHENTANVKRKEMSSSVDGGLWLTENVIYGAFFIISTIGLYLFTLQSCCGTMSFRKAKANYQKDQLIRKRYESLFSTRDNLLYHISWSKSKGEMEDAKRLMRQLADLDKEIDKMEAENQYLFRRDKR